ncbi:MAG: hypothetical protein N2450_04425 [bacterium]|nr:hypothetical protein [bacterium]
MSTLSYASIYSAQEIGIPYISTSSVISAKNGVGLTNFDTIVPNISLPAQFARLNGVKFHVGIQLQNRTILDRWNNSGNQGELYFNQFVISTPFYKSLRFGFIFTPFTINKFSSNYPRVFANELYWTKYDKVGSINKYSFVFAKKIDKFSLGIENGFLLGSITSGWKINFENSQIYDGWFTIVKKYWGFRPSLSFEFCEPKNYQISVIYTPTSTLFETLEMQDSLTSLKQSRDSKKFLPHSFAFGLAKKMNDFSVGTEFSITDKSSIYIFPNSEFKAGLWCEYARNYSILDPYFQKMRYRFGFQFAKLGIHSSNEKQIKEIGVLSGLGLPLSNSNNRLDVAMGYTQRGSRNENLSEEKITWCSISIAIGEVWFEREVPKRKK